MILNDIYKIILFIYYILVIFIIGFKIRTFKGDPG
jgi:hypothetical protein